MREVEVKFRAEDFETLERQLAGWGAAAEEVHIELDRYYNAPDRDFAQTDEALRLRSIGEANVLTYKGPRCDPQSKTRVEIEVPLAPGGEPASACGQLLERLGYRFVASVRKERRSYRLSWAGWPVRICLDEVAGLGRFVELETLAADAQWLPAREALQQLAAALGLGASERRSYLELLLSRPAPPCGGGTECPRSS